MLKKYFRSGQVKYSNFETERAIWEAWSILKDILERKDMPEDLKGKIRLIVKELDDILEEV